MRWPLQRLTDAWRVLPPMKVPRGAAGAASVDGKIHVIGGRGLDGVVVAAHEVFDPRSRTWTEAAPLPTARDHMVVIAADGRIHAIGGRLSSPINRTDAHDIYDPATGKWTSGAPLPTPRSGLASANYRGLILVLGGELPPDHTFPENEAYDPNTNRWTSLAPMPHGRHGFGGDVIGEDAFFVGGSLTPGDKGATDQLLVFASIPFPPSAYHCCGRGTRGRPRDGAKGGLMETLPRFGISRADMLKRVARFKDLKGSDGGLPDSKAPRCERTLYNVIGFQPPKDSGGAVTSPVGDDASRLSAIPISEGFNLGYCRAKPGKGPMMHNHDTNETFIPMTGTWRCSWENEKGEVESIDLNPLDVISFPPGAIRRFENVTPGPSGEDAILMFVIGGDGPKAEFTDAAMKELEDAGVWPGG